METLRYEHVSELPASTRALWDFHMEPAALERLTPRWMGLKIVDPGDGVANGSVVRAEVGFWPLRVQWEALHSSVRPERWFTDVALRSPFEFWMHHHVIERVDRGRSRLRDIIRVRPPAWLPMAVARPLLRLALHLLFRWRHRRTRQAVALSTSETTTRDHGVIVSNNV